jgi:hypothetical protein
VRQAKIFWNTSGPVDKVCLEIAEQKRWDFPSFVRRD